MPSCPDSKRMFGLPCAGVWAPFLWMTIGAVLSFAFQRQAHISSLASGILFAPREFHASRNEPSMSIGGRSHFRRDVLADVSAKAGDDLKPDGAANATGPPECPKEVMDRCGAPSAWLCSYFDASDLRDSLDTTAWHMKPAEKSKLAKVYRSWLERRLLLRRQGCRLSFRAAVMPWVLLRCAQLVGV
eukprot:scaffold3334_cov369-Prasinococcus_capsulatus_cf.AAC.10